MHLTIAKRRIPLTYANVAATIALVVAVGSTPVASAAGGLVAKAAFAVQAGNSGTVDRISASTTPRKGQLLPITQDVNIFSRIGIYYGGNGSTNFRVPDLWGMGPGGTNYVICTTGLWPARP